MVRVKKCTYGNGSIEADIYPESSTVPGKVIVSPEGKMVEYKITNIVKAMYRMHDGSFTRILIKSLTAKLLPNS